MKWEHGYELLLVVVCMFYAVAGVYLLKQIKTLRTELDAVKTALPGGHNPQYLPKWQVNRNGG